MQEPLHFDRAVVTTSAQNSGAVLQDSDGFLWIGTYGGGLIRFDGYENTVYKPGGENPFPDAYVHALYEDRGGMIWIQTGTAGLVRYDKETGVFTRFVHDPQDPDSLSSNQSTLFAMGSMDETADGTLWIGTRDGLNAFDPRKQSFIRYSADAGKPSGLSGSNIHAVLVDRGDRVWEGTDGNGLNLLDRAAGRFTHYAHDPKNPRSLPSDTVYALFEDRDGALWIGTDWGLCRLDSMDGLFTRFPADPAAPDGPKRNIVISIAQDVQGHLWLGCMKSPFDGALSFDIRSGTFRSHASAADSRHTPSTNSVRAVYRDRSDIIWIVNGINVVDKLDPRASRFTVQVPDAFPSSFIAYLYADRAGDLWVSSYPKGLTKYDPRTGSFRRIFDDFHYSAMGEDSSGSFWMATTLPAALHLFDRRTGRILKTYAHDPSDPSSMSAAVMQIGAIVEDPSNPDRLWLGTYGAGLERLDKKTGKFSHFPNSPGNPDSISNNIMFMMRRDSRGTLWIPTMGGGLDGFDTRTGRFSHFVHDPQNPKSISTDSLDSVFEDSKGRLWVGHVLGFDELDRATGAFTRYTQETGYALTVVTSIAEDGNGMLWLGSFNGDGLARFDPETKVMTVFRTGDGLPSDSFARGGVKGADGRLWFGSNAGLVSFGTADVGVNRTPPPVRVTALKQGGEPLKLGQAPERARLIGLDWRRNFFEFEFTALNYTNAGKNRYRYMLEGLDKEWFDAGTRRFGRYSGLRGGTYVLRVIASNNDGVWNAEGVSLRVRVSAPWWETWWFYAAAVFVIGSAILLAFLYRSRQLKALGESEERYRLLSVDLERRVQERTAELERSNRDLESFSYSVSHDLRAPLRAVGGYANMLRADFGGVLPAEAGRLMDSINEGAALMNTLIEGLLDLSRIQRRPLQRIGIDHSVLVEEALKTLEGERQGREVEIRVGALPSCQGDPVLIRQVWFNLLSNALKFTRPRGRAEIDVGCSTLESGEKAYFVKDNGVGMDMERAHKLFQAFQRMHSPQDFEGTGIGLALVRQIIGRHGGRVWAESRPDRGAEFFFTLDDGSRTE